MDEFVLMRFSSTPHGLQIYAWPVGVDKNHQSNRQLFFQISNQPVAMCSGEPEISTTTVEEDEKSDEASTGNETIYLSSDSEQEEPPEEKRRMPPRRCKKDARKKYREDQKVDVDKLFQKDSKLPSKKARKIPYHKRYFAL